MKENKMMSAVFSHENNWVGDDEIYLPNMTPGDTIEVCDICIESPA